MRKKTVLKRKKKSRIVKWILAVGYYCHLHNYVILRSVYCYPDPPICGAGWPGGGGSYLESRGSGFDPQQGVTCCVLENTP